jgi:hypothetical protein
MVLNVYLIGRIANFLVTAMCATLRVSLRTIPRMQDIERSSSRGTALRLGMAASLEDVVWRLTDTESQLTNRTVDHFGTLPTSPKCRRLTADWEHFLATDVHFLICAFQLLLTKSFSRMQKGYCSDIDGKSKISN